MITLRKIEPTDLPFLYQWENDAASWADGSNHNPLSQKDLRDYIATSTGDLFKDGQLRLMIEDRTTASSLTVGCIDLFDLDVRNRRAAFGLYVAPDHRGKGYGLSAVRQMEEYGFGFLHLRTLYAVISSANTACRKIYEQCNYEALSPLRNWTLEGDAILYTKSYAAGI